MKKPTLCVIFGGKSSEHEVSLASAYGIISHIDLKKYDLVCLGITKKGKWYIFEGEHKKIKDGTWEGDRVLPVTIDLSSGHLLVLGKEAYEIRVDLFFPVLHGEQGEDGRIQGLFDIAGVKYVGCGAFSSHICMDKSLAKKIAEGVGISVARGKTVSQVCENTEFTYPVFVKPTMCGSSVGVSRVENEAELGGAVREALKHCHQAIIEECIFGDEVEVGILENGKELIASSVGMVKHSGKFYDYEAKYKCESNEYLIPAPFENCVLERVREYARTLFLCFGCQGLSRFDFFIKKDGGVVFNEVNTMPGFTEKSLFPRLFEPLGISYTSVIDIVLA